MDSRTLISAIAEDPRVVARAEATVAAAAEHLKVSAPDLTPAAFGHQLDNLRQALEQRIALPSDPTEDWAKTAEILISILKLQCELLDNDLARRVRSMAEIRHALGYLRGLPPRQMIQAAPEVLSRELAFARAMISSVRGSLWLPQHVHIEDQGSDRHSRSLREYIKGRHIQLADAPLETELVRKRCGVFAPSPVNDKRVFREIMEVSGCFGYIGAPITVQGRAIGILHVDRPEPHGIVTMDHLEQLEAFAECLSVAFESAALEEKSEQQRIEVENLCGDVDGLLSRSARSVLWSLPAEAAGRRHETKTVVSQPAVHALTQREREIMSHVATGATNSQIARYLVISEGTVKSHLKHIAKKLNTSSRAAAVATYAGIAGEVGVAR
ncbi:LuxR C-terminal-related transcriptional regulator [Mycobacterium sp. TY814]|uniref:LuxR C-terminal-related transcriptional regulator n=1 Tax=unclassified Mycobacterium TaxID=2642494 RepID=UPI0027417A8A|nr:LuxR C-terminal-related transcriptional regulator [Mycobacterium sp. TY814]MDP7723608.1 LuxR C-terminal-related transcriptional regulator [Mycobacterium sp. TY814]